MDKALENDIKIFMASRIAEGISLSDIQNEVNEKFQLSMTYMDLRILAAGLDIDWQAKAAAKAEEEKKEEENAPEEAAPEEPAAETDGKTVVEISKLMRPGTALSGSVKFASGSTADWYINQTGRLGLENLVGDQPTQDDIQQFQVELEKAVYGGR